MRKVEDKALLQSPAVCRVCGMNNYVEFVDTERNWDPDVEYMVPMRGRTYLCETCVREAAEALDLFAERDAIVSALNDKLSRRTAERDEARSQQMRVVSFDDCAALMREDQTRFLDAMDRFVDKLEKRKPGRPKKVETETVVDLGSAAVGDSDD